MQLVDALKAAKSHLKQNQDEASQKTSFICFAILEAFCEKYGQAVQYGAVQAQLNTAQQYVSLKLRQLQQELGVIPTATFELATAKAYMQDENPDKQEARHLWLDSLIKELEHGLQDSDS